MTALMVLLAVVLPWLAGVLVCRLLLDHAGPGRMTATLGAGFVIGFGAWGVALRFAARTPVADLFTLGTAWLVGIIVVLIVASVVLARRTRVVATQAAPGAATAPLPDRLQRVLRIVLLAILAVFGLVVLLQAMALPTLAWDAWNAWLAKSKAWFHAGSMLPTLDPPAWLAATPGSGIAVLAAHYPDTIPRLALWTASAAGAWDEAAVHLLWPALWLALGLMLFGSQRRAGVGITFALAVTAVVLTMPLILAHATLAGYADLWVAATLLIAVAQTEQWLRTRRWQEGVLALLAVAMLPMLKQEGAIWLLCLGAAFGLALLPRRGRWMVLGAAIAVLLASLPFGGLSLPLPGLGWVRIAWGEIVVPGIGTLALHWRPVLGPVLDALFLRDNWSLLWYLAPLVLWTGRRALVQPSLGALGWFFAFAVAFQCVLFFFTDASQWAQNLTSLNRIVLQMVPALVFWLSLLLCRRAEALPGRASDTRHPSLH